MEGSLNQTLEEVVAFGDEGRRRTFNQHCVRALSVRMEMVFVCAVITMAMCGSWAVEMWQVGRRY